jgi:hypothetical protein
MTIKIDKKVPLDAEHPRRKYPFNKLEKVGWSFLMREGNVSSIRSAANLYGKRHGCKFSVRTTEEGIRVWRIENDN